MVSARAIIICSLREMFLRYISAMDLLKSGVPQLGMRIGLRYDAISKSYTKMRIS